MTPRPLPLADQDAGTCTRAEARAIGADTATAVAATLKAVAEPLRLRMLSFIAASPEQQACVCDLTALTDLSQPTVSHHLRVLRDVGVLTSDRRGTWVWYSITPAYRDAITALLGSFSSAALDSTDGPHGLAGLADVDTTLDRMADGLADRHPDLAPDLVLRIVRESYVALARTAKVSAHLVALTERFARQRLADLTRDRQAGSPQVLFVCVANAGRSQLAAALVRHYAGDRIVVRSAGSTPAAQVHDGVRDVLAELGVRADEVFPKPLTDDAVRAADVVVTMGCGDVCPVLPGVRYEDWSVGDPALASPAGIAQIRADLDAHVRELVTDLLPDLDLSTQEGTTRV